MTRFLRTEDDVLINADQITRIETGGERRCIATLRDGSVVRFYGNLDQIEMKLCPVVAAARGHTELQYIDDRGDGDDPLIIRMPVVAWRLGDDCALPITVDGEDTLGPGCTILLPDGQVVHQGVMTCPNEEGWREEMAKQAKHKREQERAKPKLRPV